jgi:hypothetical protein
MFRNSGLKLLALLVAIMAFYAIRREISFELTYVIPVVVEVEKGIAVLDQNPRNVQIVLRGSQDDVRHLDQKKLKIIVRPKDTMLDGATSVPLRPRDVKGAERFRVVDISHAYVAVSFDREAEKEMDVAEPQIIGTPVVGRAELDYQPKKVRIRGSERGLRDEHTVHTEHVNVDGHDRSFSTQVRVLAPDKIWVSAIHPPFVNVDVKVVTEAATREWKGIRVQALLDASQDVIVTFDPPRVTVALHGPGRALEAITADSLLAFVRCSGLDPEATYELPVKVHLSGNADVLSSVEPSTVKVTLTAARMGNIHLDRPIIPAVSTNRLSTRKNHGSKQEDR